MDEDTGETKEKERNEVYWKGKRKEEKRQQMLRGRIGKGW